MQLVSGNHALLGHIERAGERSGLIMLPPLRKPFRASDIQRIAQDCRQRMPAACDA